MIQTDKGQALDILRHQQGASAAVFFGDDVTDEKAFRRLHGPDVGVKVGDGETLADYRVESPEDVALALNFLLECRRTWLLGGHSTPIERLTMLSNGRTVALLTPEADVVWMCHPQADSAAVFSRLLGDANAGHFEIGPERESLPLSQRYVDGTMTVETRWASLLVTDYLSHDVGAGRTDLIRVISGQAKAVVSFAPRPEFAQAPVHLRADDGGLRVFATNEPMVLRAPGVEWEIVADGVHETARAVVDPSQGPVVLELRCGTEDLSESPVDDDSRRERAESYWRDWAETLTLPELNQSLMKRSALTLRGLVHADTGAIMAAATTSLPEEIGGVRNWDYRYCWIRDAAMTAASLVSLGSTDEAEGYLNWLHRVIETMHGPERLHPLYALSGAILGPEAVIDSLPGYAGSRPVRVGNAANVQVQLDVFGPVVQLISDLVHKRVAEREGRRADRRRLEPGQRDGVRRREPLGRAGSRHLGDPRRAEAPRVLEGDVLADGRPGPEAGRRVRPRGATGVGHPARCHLPAGAGTRLERRGAVLHRGLRRHRPGRRDAAHRPVRPHRTVRSAVRRHSRRDRDRITQRCNRLPLSKR